MRRLLQNVIICTFPMCALSAVAEDDFRLSNHRTSVVDGAVAVSADFHFDLPERVKTALDQGVDLLFEIEIEVYNPHDYLPDEELAKVRFRRRLSHHALTRKYTLDDLSFGRRDSYSRLDDALVALGNVADISLLNAAVVRAHRESIVRLRINLPFNELPFPLRLQAMVLPDWYVHSPWFAWKLN